MGWVEIRAYNPLTKLIGHMPPRLRDRRVDVTRRTDDPNRGAVFFVTPRGKSGAIMVDIDEHFPTPELIAQLTLVLA